jgi:hypothetical protein
MAQSSGKRKKINDSGGLRKTADLSLRPMKKESGPSTARYVLIFES